MRVEALVFILSAAFIALITPVYFFWSDDPTGTTALVLTFGLLALIGYYLFHTGNKIGERPEDRKDGEIEDAAGEYGFFSPQSVWPLALGASVSVAVVGVLIGAWLLIIGATLVAMCVMGFVFEYYKGVYEGEPRLRSPVAPTIKGVTGGARSGGRGHLRTVTLVVLLAGSAGLTGCASASERRNAENTSGAPTSSAPTESAVQLNVTPAPGSSAVPPDAPVVVTAAQGKLEVVRLSGPAGDVQGALGPDATTWTSTEVLDIGAAYSLSATATDQFGLDRTLTATFTTLTPTEEQRLRARVSPLDGETVGVGMPVVLYLTAPVDDRAAVEERLSVTSTPSVEGAWHWVSDVELHWRPRDVWPAGTAVSVDIPLAGVRTGDDRWGDQDRVVSFSITEHAMTSIVDLTATNMQVYQDGELLRTLPVTAGKPGWETRNGTKVVLSKEPQRIMDAATVGIDPTDPDYYRLDVEYALRLTWSGEFVHAAPWSEGAHGQANVSHGSVGLSTADAAWLYDVTTRGDLVRVIGSPRPLELGNGYTDWNLDWDEWLAGSALVAGAASSAPSG